MKALFYQPYRRLAGDRNIHNKSIFSYAAPLSNSTILVNINRFYLPNKGTSVQHTDIFQGTTGTIFRRSADDLPPPIGDSL